MMDPFPTLLTICVLLAVTQAYLAPVRVNNTSVLDTTNQPPNCPLEDKRNPVYFPHPKSCQLYYECFQGNLNTDECLPGLHFNAITSKCDFPQKAHCSKPENSLQINNPKVDDHKTGVREQYGTLDNNNTFPSNEFKINQTRVAPKLNNNIMPKHDEKRKQHSSVEVTQTCVNQTFTPHECSSVHFYKCVDGRKIKMRCPDGLIFDSAKSKCGWPPRGKCVVTFTQDCTHTSVYFPDYDDPKSFYQCSNGAYYKFKCPTELVFNQDLNVCDWAKDIVPRRQDFWNAMNCTDPAQCSVQKNHLPLKERDGWVPVVGSRPTWQEAPPRTVQGWGNTPGYTSFVRWPDEKRAWQAQNNVLSAVEDTMAARVAENKPQGKYHLLTTEKGKQPTGWMQTRQWSPSQVKNGGVIEMHGKEFVQVSVDLSAGMVDIANNLTDFTIHFKPKNKLDTNPIQANLIISKDASGITTINTGIISKDDKANITVKVRGTDAVS